MARPGLPSAYFDEIILQIDRLPEGIQRVVSEPGTLRLSRTSRAERRAARMCYRALTDTLHRDEEPFWIEVEPEIRLPGGLLGVPDIAGWRLPQNLTDLPPESLRALTPDLCCKVITADTAKSYRSRLPLYARAGVRWFWFLEPIARTLEVFEITASDSTPIVFAKDNDEPIVPPFERPLPLAPLWL